MKIVLAGGTGFLGRPLATALARDGHEVVILTRGSTAAPSAPIRRTIWMPDGHSGPWSPELDDADAIVNMAGESITAKRWTRARTQQILASRMSATRSLVEAVQAARMPPAVFVSASAVGYYGPRGDQIATEDTPHGSDFLADPWAAHGRTGNGPHGEGGVGVTLGDVARCGDAGRRKQGIKSG